MGNKKHIVVAALLAMLTTGIGAAVAGSSNSLLQMDVKKSSQVDSVDVTFYTTSSVANSVVTRKSNNRYVVLLPNTDSSSSITPGLGGVKDLVSDIDVKHVNDGIGGYTKITFTTTKPVNIKTYMKKTNPLTQAQKDYKEIIAKNDVGSIKLMESQKVQQQTTTPQNITTPKIEPKVAVSINTNPVKVQNATQKAVQKVANSNANLKLVSVNPESIQKSQPKIVVAPAPVSGLNFSNSNQIKVADVSTTTSVKTKAETDVVKTEPVKSQFEEKVDAPVVAETLSKEENIVDEKNASLEQENNSRQIPNWVLIAGASLVGLILLNSLLKLLSSARKDNLQVAEQFVQNESVSTSSKISDYNEIINNDTMNWQEKYKRYSEKGESVKENVATGLSYVADISDNSKSTVLENNSETLEKFKINNINASEDKKLSLKKQVSLQSGANNVKHIANEEEFKKQMHSKISELEHSLAQVASADNIVDNSNKYKSEDDSIIENISNVKLKSFSKPISLKNTSRSLLDSDNTNSRNKSYKEGRFVKLKNSPLSVTRRSSAATNLNVSDLINTGSKYLMNNGEMKMNREKENYLLSSLDEYLSILDGEGGAIKAMTKPSVADSLAQVKSSVAMSRSGVTNPISRASNPISGKSSVPYMNGLVVKSGYNIDAEKGIYLVNIDGVSALVGRINDNVFVLKKFDSVIDKPLQVRQDDANVYIVKVGRYKCLVDVSKDRMGTLIEI